MVSVSQLKGADFRGLEAAEETWQGFVGRLNSGATAFKDRIQANVQQSGWNGLAATAAETEIAPMYDRYRHIAFSAKSVQGALFAAYTDFKQAQDDLNDALADALFWNLTVAEDGTVGPPPFSGDDFVSRYTQEEIFEEYPQLRGEIKRIEQLAKDALRLAETADRSLVAALGHLSPEKAWNEQGLPLDLTDLPPNWPGTDYDRPHGSEEATPRDAWTKTQLYGMAGYGAIKDWPTAKKLLLHWLGNSGDRVDPDVAVMLKNSPSMRQSLNELLENAPRNGGKPWDTGWTSHNFAPQELDNYYAYNGYQMRVRGDGDGGYTVEFYKRYNFGTSEENRSPIGPLNLSQADISHLHASGSAQDFNVYGALKVP
ncbi:hypothetical protein ABGB12_01340 [Actinocorallia sp. B10E7]|uniref:hypothetical protein n=1 Tax=Actinocorallia sp. B10E7 TaxID=3153558 RepID=UPI00325EDEF7